jgi:hypothetical protein
MLMLAALLAAFITSYFGALFATNDYNCLD